MGDPYVSIVILTNQAYPEVVKQINAQTFKQFEIIIAREKGIVNAMNNALKRAKGQVLVRIDDDVRIPREWLQNIVKTFASSYVGGVTGPTYVPYDRREYRDSIKAFEKPNWFLRWLCDNEFKPSGIRKCGMVSYDSNYQERHNSYKTLCVECDHLEGTNWAMRTELIRRVGGFDPAFDGVAEWFDTDVEQKVLKLGYKLMYNPSAYLYHMLEEAPTYRDRFGDWSRIKNWLRFHKRHSKFHYKMVVWLCLLISYTIFRR